jgi:hypothetical protein
MEMHLNKDVIRELRSFPQKDYFYQCVMHENPIFTPPPRQSTIATKHG